MRILIGIFALVGLTLGIPPLKEYPADFGDPSESTGQHGIRPFVTDRIPASIIPSLCRLEIRPILDEGDHGDRFTAPGKIWITGVAVEAVSFITLNSVEIQINQQTATVTEEGTNLNVPVISHLIEPAKEFHTVNLGQPLTIGRNYTLYLEFISKVNTEVDNGLYVAVYKDANGQNKNLASTDFQAPDARKAFPCFDEPHFKPEWDIEIIRQSHYNSLSNMDLLRTEAVPELPGWVKDVYNRLVPMSSYLICFAVSDFKFEIADGSLYRLPVRVWGPPPLIDNGNGQFSPNFSAKVMAFFETYYQVPYSLPKMDKISIPDYSSGAMENWGLNTYRDTRLLYEEGISTHQDMFSMTNTISHELVHQWWGNLITCLYWNDLWIQEGAATYYASVGVKAVMPELQPMETLITATVQRSLAFDASPATHPIHNLGIDPSNVPVLFDTLTYHKGASLIRMMNAFLTEQLYNNAMTRLFNRFAFKNLHQDDMFAMLDEVHTESGFNLLPAGVTVTDIMAGWTNQSGFPIVSVDWNQQTGQTTLGQRRFFEKQEEDDGTDTTKWNIPVAILRDIDSNVNLLPQSWILENQDQISMNIQGQWLIINPQTIGYYRVLYRGVLLDRIIQQLMTDHTVFDVQTRSSLLDDSLAEAYAGYLPLNDALRMTQYLANERELFPWVTFVTQMALPYRIFMRSSSLPLFKKYVLELMAPVVAEMGFEPKAEDTNPLTLLRTRLVEWNCNLGNDACIEFAKTKFALWLATPGDVSLVFPDLQPSIYCTAIAYGGDTEWNFLWSQYQIADRDVMQQQLLRALACSKSSFRLNTLMDMAIDRNSGILNKHRNLAIQAVAGNSIGLHLSFTFIRDNYDTIMRRWGRSMVTAALSTLATNMNDQLDKTDLETFIASKQPELGSVSLTNLDNNIRWKTNHLADFVTFLETP